LAKTLARFVNVPFVIADATTLTQASLLCIDILLQRLEIPHGCFYFTVGIGHSHKKLSIGHSHKKLNFHI